MLILLVFLKGDSNHIEINADVILCKKIQQFLKISDFFHDYVSKTQEQVARKSNKKSRKNREKFGSGNWTRTSDIRINSTKTVGLTNLL